MGCDIHGWLEVRQDDGWVPVLDLREGWSFEDDDLHDVVTLLWPQSAYSTRTYTVFSLVAGVRSSEDHGTAGREPRGLPEDASEIVRKDAERWGVDGHSHSWYTLRELLHLKLWEGFSVEDLEPEEWNTISSFWEDLIPRMMSMGVSQDDVRWVFWFDN